MSKRFIITEDEKNHIKGLYLINEGASKCPNEKFDIVDVAKTKKQISRDYLINYVSSSRSDVSVIQYCDGKRNNSTKVSVKNRELVGI